MKEISRLRLAHLPTPMYELKRLGKKLHGHKIYIKRDDQTGIAFGGNKIRKLEFLAAEALEKGCKTLVTAGAIQSNHCRQTAAVAGMLGMKCILVLGGDEPELPEANTYLDVLLGAKIHWTTRQKIKKKLNEVFLQAEEDGLKPYLVPYGGSSPLGAVSYAFALKELQEQISDLDWIIFATSSGGTHAGLHAGKMLLDLDVKILGISIDEPGRLIRRVIADLAEEVCELLGEKRSVFSEDILVNDEYLGEGYAVMGAAEIEAIKMFALEEAVMIDPVYTGRAAAGLIDLIKKGYFRPDEKLLFWHTGGTPALFVDKYRQKLMNS